MSPDVISVVIPAYREGRFLDDCLSSVQAQTYSDLEIIVVDDAGLDESIGVALRHARQDSRIHVLRLRENHGLGASRNVGLASASGSLVTFLDADDLLPPDSIQVRQNRFDELRRDGAGEPRVAAVYGDWRHIEELAVGPPLTGPSRPLEAVDLTSTDGGNPFIVAAPLVDREALLDSGGFAEGVPCCEDYLAWMRLLDTGAVFEPVREVVAFYRQKRGSMLRETAQPMLAITAAVHDWHRLQVSQGRPDEGPHHLGWGPDYHEQANGQKMEPKNLTSILCRTGSHPSGIDRHRWWSLAMSCRERIRATTGGPRNSSRMEASRWRPLSPCGPHHQMADQATNPKSGCSS